MTHEPLYIWSKNQARQSGEMDLWCESHNANCRCAIAIEKALTEYYRENTLDIIAAKKMIEEYGFERVNWVLANTVQFSRGDSRYSDENKKWARGFSLPYDERYVREKFALCKDPFLVNTFIDHVRGEWNALGLYDESHCYENSRRDLDYTGQVVVLDPCIFKDEFKRPEQQLFYAKFGNGCRADSLGTKVYGQRLHNGKECYYRRSEILGVMKLDLVPDWAKEKVMQITFKKKDGEVNTEVEDVRQNEENGPTQMQ